MELGWALTKQGQGKTFIKQMYETTKGWQAKGTRPMLLAWLAEAYGEMGQPEEGLAVLAEGLAEVEKTGGRFFEAELYRLKGELLLAKARHQATGDGQQERATDP